MLLEGIPAPTIEHASSQAGYPAPVLQLSDELNLNLMRKIREDDEGGGDQAAGPFEAHPAARVIDLMIDAHGRAGKLAGAGFYDYFDGRRGDLWPGLESTRSPRSTDPAQISLRDLQERMLFIESIEAVKCLDEGVIESVADGNVGSIMGIGFPGWTGGVLQYINGYRRRPGRASSIGAASSPPPTAIGSSRRRRSSTSPTEATRTATSRT